MNTITKSKILQTITDYYLTSGDFNGICAETLCQEYDLPWKSLVPIIEVLITEEKVGVISSTIEMNPHIIRTGFRCIEDQIKQLNDSSLYHICFYPREKHLTKVVNSDDYLGKPYKLSLALGAPQLEIRFFDLLVLEQYRNDPRYYYECNEVGGHIVVQDEFYESEIMPEKDKIILQSFGLAFDEEFNRAVGAFICDLANLTPEHQQIWKARELQGNWRIHPDFYRSQVLGIWGQHTTIFKAFLLEQHIINKMAAAMARAPLFRIDCGEYCETKPKQFGYIIRPTAVEYGQFIHLLDKLMSENIDIKFFKKDVPLEEERILDDGRVEFIKRGTIMILDNWIRKYFKASDWEPWDYAISVFKKVRKMRQKPAHNINDDYFDQKYIKEQRELMKEAYTAIRILRDALETHPIVRNAKIKIPDYLDEDKILTI